MHATRVAPGCRVFNCYLAERISETADPCLLHQAVPSERFKNGAELEDVYVCLIYIVCILSKS